VLARPVLLLLVAVLQGIDVREELDFELKQKQPRPRPHHRIGGMSWGCGKRSSMYSLMMFAS